MREVFLILCVRVSFAFLSLAVSASLIGWSSLIEPNWIRTSQIIWPLTQQQAHMHGLRVVQISDLHLGLHTPCAFVQKISKKIKDLSPDIIVFCGDFICRSTIQQSDVLRTFLDSLQAPLGTFVVFGNHDYEAYVSRNIHGQIDIIPQENSQPLKRAFVSVYQSFFASNHNFFSDRLQKQNPHPKLLEILKQTSLIVLHNQTYTIPNICNIVGLGDLFAKQFLPEEAFKNYNPLLPGIVLSHNPDTALMLEQYPGDMILSGHTHGPQISLPWPSFAKTLTNRLSGLENPNLSRGLFSLFDQHKLLYVNRGLGGLKRVRFCSPPEICLIRCEYAQR